MNEDLFGRIKTRLKLEHYSMNNEWLRDCVEFYVNQHENPTTEQILQFVRVQWQLSDLREINNENGCLPHNLSQQPFVTLPGKYILQVEQMYDIATSKYKQLENIRNIHISEEEITETEKTEKYEPTKKRMIQLRLTDGLQDIIGIEYCYMPQLNDMLLPGYKIMIKGPVKCRRGVLLLEETNFKGIGGEVDSLLITNAVENVLARALNLPENPNPYNDNEMQSNDVKQDKQKVEDNLFEDDFEVNFNDLDQIEDSHKDNTSTKDARKIETENTDTEMKSVQNSERIQILDDDDDCILEMVDESQFMEEQMGQINITAPYRTLPPEDGDIIVINEDLPDTNADTFKKPKLSSGMTNSSTVDFRSGINNKQQASLNSGKRNLPTSPSEVFIPKRGKMDKQTTESSKVLNSSTSKITKFLKPLSTPQDSKSSLSNQPTIIKFTKPTNSFQESKLTEFTKALSTPSKSKITEFKETIDVPDETEESPSVPGDLEHCEFIHTIKNREFTETTYKTVRAHVQDHGKLGKKDSLWSFDAVIGDSTETMLVSFSDQVLQDLIGCSYQEFSVKKKLKKFPEIEQELRAKLRDAERKIQTLDALLLLELNPNKKPVVTKITDLTQKQKQMLDKKVEKFKTQL